MNNIHKRKYFKEKNDFKKNIFSKELKLMIKQKAKFSKHFPEQHFTNFLNKKDKDKYLNSMQFLIYSFEKNNINFWNNVIFDKNFIWYENEFNLKNRHKEIIKKIYDENFVERKKFYKIRFKGASKEITRKLRFIVKKETNSLFEIILIDSLHLFSTSIPKRKENDFGYEDAYLKEIENDYCISNIFNKIEQTKTDNYDSSIRYTNINEKKL